MSDQVYTTAQVAESLGISADTVRTYKKRNTDKLLETTHWLKDESNALLWTEKGIEVLTILQKGIEPPEGSNVEPPQSSEVQTELEPEPLDNPLLSRYEPLLDMMADAIAPELQQRLDNKIIGKVQSLNKKPEPLTATECVTILQRLGLKPANPAALLTGSKVQALPPSNQ
jgi:hypothetical protein